MQSQRRLVSQFLVYELTKLNLLYITFIHQLCGGSLNIDQLSCLERQSKGTDGESESKDSVLSE